MRRKRGREIVLAAIADDCDAFECRVGLVLKGAPHQAGVPWADFQAVRASSHQELGTPDKVPAVLRTEEAFRVASCFASDSLGSAEAAGGTY